MTSRAVAAVSVGCGFLCEVTAHLKGQSLSVEGACPHARDWFGDGTAPDAILVDNEPATFETAIRTATEILMAGHGGLVARVLPGLSIEALRPVLAIADALEGVVSTPTSVDTERAIVAGQRRGRAAATLGELANRADVVLLWGVGPEYLPCVRNRIIDRPGTHVPRGRAGRTVIAVRIGNVGVPDGADISGSLDASDELMALSLLRSAAQGRPIPAPAHVGFLDAIAARLASARYIGMVAPAESPAITSLLEPSQETPRAPERSESLIALAQAWNGPTRAALLSLRAGGNRNGAEALLTWQTGYPFGVSYRSGVPTHDLDFLPGISGEPAVLRVGYAPRPAGAGILLDDPAVTVAIGPRASLEPFARVVIDTGVLGVHEGGTVYRADDVPVAVPAILDGPRTAAMTLEALERSVLRALREAAA
jgi:formylmethanofuran dehydrogenase subunit B